MNNSCTHVGKNVALQMFTTDAGYKLTKQFFLYTRHVHKVSFPLVPQLANLILREVTVRT
jgi:hypothetical protein